MWHLWMLFVGVSLLLAPTGRALICTRRPANTATPKSPVDENYVISISGNPETYILGQEYNGERCGVRERTSSLALRLNFNIPSAIHNDEPGLCESHLQNNNKIN